MPTPVLEMGGNPSSAVPHQLTTCMLTLAPSCSMSSRPRATCTELVLA